SELGSRRRRSHRVPRRSSAVAAARIQRASFDADLRHARRPVGRHWRYVLRAGAWFDMSSVVSRAWHTTHDLFTQDFPLSLWLPGSTQEHVGVPAFALALLLSAAWAFGLWKTRTGFGCVWKRWQPERDCGMAIWLVLLPAVPIAFLLTSKFELGPRD